LWTNYNTGWAERDGTDTVFTTHVDVSVPEPSTLLLLGVGLAGLGFARRKQA
jgi:hypothetical protein